MFDEFQSDKNASQSDDASEEDIGSHKPRSRMGQIWFDLPDGIKHSPFTILIMFGSSFLPGRTGHLFVTTWMGHIIFGIVAGLIVGIASGSR